MVCRYCGEGTIWHVAKQGLPEAMIRSYTHQILVAIEVLHRNGVVHRDIKGHTDVAMDGQTDR